MADSNVKEQSQYSGKDSYKNLIRKDGQTWEAEKYARMGVYAYLLNRMVGKPERWGLDNEDVSFEFKDTLREKFDEIVNEYIPDKKIGKIDLSNPIQKKQFLAEMDEYSEHCQVINPNKTIPSIAEMENFLQAVCDDKNSFYMSIHKSVVEKSGEFGDDEKRKMESLIAERNLKEREIDDATYALRRDNFWTGLKGAGALGSGGLMVGGTIGALFLGPFGIVVAGASLIGGGIGLRNFGSQFVSAVKENIKKRQQLRDLKKRGGPKGKRGLKEIKDQIEYNKGLLRIMDSIGKIKSDGSMPTLEEFIDYIKKNEPFVYERINGGRYEGNFKKLWRQSKGHYYSNSGGDLKKVMGYMSDHAVTEVTKNDELGIERQSYYKAIFDERLNKDHKTIAEDEKTGKPKKVDGKLVYSENAMTLDDFIRYNDKLVNDEGSFDKMKREYLDLQKSAARSCYTVFMDAIFNQAYEPNSAARFANLIGENGNKNIKDALARHPEGGKLQILQNAINFLNIESKMDGDLRLNGNLGVSIKAQLVTNENFESEVNKGCDQIIAGLKKAGITFSESAKSESEAIVNSIAGLLEGGTATKGGLEKFNDDINRSSMPEKMKTYLKAMVKRKQAEVPMNTSEIQALLPTDDLEILNADPSFERKLNDIKNKISKGITKSDLSEYDAIKKDIDGLTCSAPNSENALDSVKSKLRYALEESKRAFDTRESVKARAGVLEAMENGNFNASENMKELFDEITKINYDYFKNNYNDILKFYTGTVMKCSSDSLKNYLSMRLANKFVLEISTALRNASLYKDNVDQLRTDLMRIKSCPFLSESQKTQLIEGTSDSSSDSKLNENGFNYHISISLNAEVKQMQVDLFNPEQKYGVKINKYLNHSLKEGGFREELEGSDLKNLKKKYEAYQMISRSKIPLFQFSYGNFTTDVESDVKSPESRLIVSLLTSSDGSFDNFDDKSKDSIDKAVGFAGRMTGAVASLSKVDIMTFAKDTDSARKKMLDKLDFKKLSSGAKLKLEGGIEKYEYKDPTTEQECRVRIVELILYKRQIVAIIKGQMRQLREKFGSAITPESLESKPDLGIAYNAIKDTWSPILNDIDKQMEHISEIGLGFGFDFKGYDTHDAYIEKGSSVAGRFLEITTAYDRANENTTVINTREM